MELTLELAIKLMQMLGGDLDLHSTSITTLPEGLTVGGSLDLCDSSITTLPEGLTVGGAMLLEQWGDVRLVRVRELQPEQLSLRGMKP